MRFKVESTIPQRQYENIHISYETDDPREIDRLVGMALTDLRKYNNIIQKETPLPIYRPKEGEEIAILDKGVVKDILVFKDGTWSIKNG